jgi:hypothetical protein
MVVPIAPQPPTAPAPGDEPTLDEPDDETAARAAALTHALDTADDQPDAAESEDPKTADAQEIERLVSEAVASLPKLADDWKQAERSGAIRSAMEQAMSNDAQARQAGIRKLKKLGVTAPPAALAREERRTNPAARKISGAAHIEAQLKRLRERGGKRSAISALKAQLETADRKRRDGLKPGTKAAILVDLLSRKEGASMKEMLAATGWERCKFTAKKSVARAGLKFVVREVDGEERFFALKR